MIDVTSQDAKTGGMARIGSQPIALAAGVLVVIVLGISAIALWRAYTGVSPEQERVVAARQLQVRTAQASEQLVEKTKGLEATQQESIDQLQVVQGLTEAIDGLRQSFASAQSSEGGPPSARNKSIRTRSHAIRNAHRKHAKSRS